MTYREITKELEKSGINDAAFDASQLICFFEKVSSAQCRIGDYNSKSLMDAVQKRCAGYPLQYIIGQWDFFGYTFKVSPHCLIPRFDTEILCEFLVENLSDNCRFADLCTGSGCIAVAALKKAEKFKNVSCTAVDIFSETLEIAKENARTNGVFDKIEFLLADVKDDCLKGEYDIIVSNPPYISPGEMKSLPKEVTFEPEIALTDGVDGLFIIRKIIEIYPKHLKKNGKLAIEIGASQGERVKEIAQKQNLSVKLLKDTGNRDRVAVIELP